MENGGKKEIPNTTKWLMLGIAAFYDTISLVSLIPLIGWLLGIFVWIYAFLTFFVWFMIYDVNIVSFNNPKKLGGSLLTSIIELFPEIGAFPSWIILVLWLTRVEKIVDKTVSKVPGGRVAMRTVLKK